jgi:tetratricopeptide (TPR) repeat protein
MYAMGWTVRVVREGLHGLAAKQGLDASGAGDGDIWRWLRGEVRPTVWMDCLCLLFRCHQSLLGWPPQGNESPVDYTPADDQPSEPRLANSVPLWVQPGRSHQRVAEVLDNGAASDSGPWEYRTSEARMLDAARHHYEQMYRERGGITTGARVQAVINSLRYLVQNAYSDAAGREVYRTLGGLIAVAGICAYDSDSHESADDCFQQALQLAQACGDRAFGAYVYGLLGTKSLLLGRNDEAVDVSEVAITTAGTHLSNALRADLRALQAKAFARMKATDNAIRSMRLAEAAAARIQPDEEPPETGYVQPGLIEEQLADALRTLGDLSSALAYAERSVRMSTHTRGRANRLVILTQIATARGDLEYAADAVGKLLKATDGIESKRFRDRLLTIRSNMDRHRSSRTVRDVVDELDSRLTLPIARR